jgi:site-specific DNA-methyltransferase (adenine-specific)
MLEITRPVSRLFYGDNLAVMRDRDCFPNDFVDLIYLDPPFNSNASYNVLFKAPDGQESHAQIEAFEDTWHWTSAAEKAFDEVVHSRNSDAAELLRAMRSFLHENDMMAYLSMMAVRLLELHRVLKSTGSLYLHCDPTASHYLKILLDAIFGKENFKNEIVWRRSHPKGHAFTRYATSHDVILYYGKDVRRTIWNQTYTPHDPIEVLKQYSLKDEDGRRYQLTSLLNPNPDRPNLTYKFLGATKVWRWTKERMQQEYEKGRIIVPKGGEGIPRYKRYLDEQEGIPIGDFWDDIGLAAGSERLGYPTQKPLALLERIISASSNEDDLVLDPFCGCGTTVHAAQKLNRRWIGIDITHLAISLVKRRLIDAFPMAKFEIHGVPKDIGAARELARTDPHQFQLWAVSMIEAQPYKGGRKGGDTGIDGYLYFKPDGKVTEKAVVSVKGGQNLNPNMVRDLAGTVEAERAKMGIFVTLEDPTTGMRTAALRAGYYETDYGKYEKIQILTVEDLFDGKKPHMPWVDPSVFKKAKRETTEKQSEMDL